ncbi:THAP domain-containing protein 5-like isoform X2 [Hyla sarda]|nr:THAP domain-containing protein 5-like isoform X2 [Hyla sarda]XP_056373561.1 THAP domain-containing protein 5-like isoform X2 [Hyla sarda]XP_056373569.1 THAP domain-containing protein 5-like isoform X2 [Hyla sarda]XP_056373576.1 THAP domain-containing protein 5-like isoform X2 [Hyla sarda]
MPMTCVAYGCNNHFVKGCGKQFFRFPMKDPDRLSKWVSAIRRKNWKPSASSRICSDHFTEIDYMLRPGAMVPRLRLDAVPSVFDGFPNHLKERLEKKKTLTKKIDEQIIVIGSKNGTHAAVQTSFESIEPKDTNVSAQNSEINVSRVSTPETKQETVVKQMDMIQSCAVHGCSNTSYEGCQQQFFRFPVNNPELLSKWLKALHCECSTSLRSTSICSNHFTEKDYMLYPGETVPQLAPDAVPSLLIKVPKESQAAMESQDTHQADPTENSVLAKQTKGQILMSSKFINPKERSNKESLSEQKQQVKHGPLEKSSAVTCAVHGCNSVFAKECGKRFFRFPMKNPVRLSKWIKALQYSKWEPSASSRICSDHFKDKDYILRPGMLLPQLRIGAVPSVLKARKSRRKQIAATNQNIEYCRSSEVWDEFQKAEIHRPCDHTYSAVHNEEDSPRLNPDTEKLKKKVRTLQRQIQRQRHTIKKLSERIAQLKNNSAQLQQK